MRTKSIGLITKSPQPPSGPALSGIAKQNPRHPRVGWLFAATAFAVGLQLASMPRAAFALVDMRNANYAETWTDMVLPGSGYDMKIRRMYNSRSLFNGIFGFGWCSDLETRLLLTAENSIKVIECGGGMEVEYIGKNYDPKNINKTVDYVLAEVKKRNKKATPEYLKGLKFQLQINSQLRDEFARELKISKSAIEGDDYFASGRANERIVFKGSQYLRYLPDSTFQVFDANGRLVRMQDRNGNSLVVVYTKDLVTELRDNNGRKLALDYVPQIKKVKSIAGPQGLRAQYEYKGEDLVKVVDAENKKYVYEYDELHNMTLVTKPDGKPSRLKYDKNKDWVIGFENAAGCKETYDYGEDAKDPVNNYWSEVKKVCSGKITNQSRYEFYHRVNAQGGRYLYRTKQSVNGNVTEVIYHERFGRPVSITKNQFKTTYELNNDGLVSKKREGNRIMSFAYNATCQKVAAVQTDYYEQRALAAAGKPGAAPSSSAAANEATQLKLAKRIKTAFRYDPKCNLVGAANDLGQKIQIAYDQRGRIARIEDQAKKVVTIKYEEKFGKPAIVTRPGLGSIAVSYKSNGEVNQVKSKDGDRVALQVASIFNNLLEVIAPATQEIGI